MKRWRLSLRTAFVGLGVALIVIIIGVAAGSRRQSLAAGEVAQAAASDRHTATAVSTRAVERAAKDDVAEVVGTIIAAQRAELAPKIMGRVTAVTVHEGQRVKKGQVLVQLEAADLAAGVAQASANAGAAGAAVAQAQTAAALQRAQSRSRIEQAASQLKAAQAHLSAVIEGTRTQEKAVAAQGIALAEAQARNAEANHRRYQRLHESGAVSAMDADRYRTAYETAAAQLEMAKQQASLANEGSRRQEIDAARSQVVQAEEALVLARASAAENRIKDDQLRVARAQLGQASAARAGAGVQLSYSRIVAPFAGVVTARLADPGDLATPGQPVVIIEDDSLYRLEASVPEDLLRYARLGQHVKVALDAPPRTLTATVSRITPSADPGSRTFTLKADLCCADGLISGRYGRLLLRQGRRQIIEVPTTAVLRRGQLHQVYVVELGGGGTGRARLRLVTVGETSDGRIEILSGLEPGERVVARPTRTLEDGQVVREVAQ